MRTIMQALVGTMKPGEHNNLSKKAKVLKSHSGHLENPIKLLVFIYGPPLVDT